MPDIPCNIAVGVTGVSKASAELEAIAASAQKSAQKIKQAGGQDIAGNVDEIRKLSELQVAFKVALPSIGKMGDALIASFGRESPAFRSVAALTKEMGGLAAIAPRCATAMGAVSTGIELLTRAIGKRTEEIDALLQQAQKDGHIKKDVGALEWVWRSVRGTTDEVKTSDAEYQQHRRKSQVDSMVKDIKDAKDPVSEAIVKKWETEERKKINALMSVWLEMSRKDFAKVDSAVVVAKADEIKRSLARERDHELKMLALRRELADLRERTETEAGRERAAAEKQLQTEIEREQKLQSMPTALERYESGVSERIAVVASSLEAAERQAMALAGDTEGLDKMDRAKLSNAVIRAQANSGSKYALNDFKSAQANLGAFDAQKAYRTRAKGIVEGLGSTEQSLRDELEAALRQASSGLGGGDARLGLNAMSGHFEQQQAIALAEQEARKVAAEQAAEQARQDFERRLQEARDKSAAELKQAAQTLVTALRASSNQANESRQRNLTDQVRW